MHNDFPSNAMIHMVEINMEEVVVEPSAKRHKLEAEGNDAFNTDVDSKTACNNAPFTNVTAVTDHPANEREKKYGLHLFVNKSGRLSGIIKQRYSDFVVRECNQDGDLVQLTNLNHIDDVLAEKALSNGECPIKDEVQLGKIEEFVKVKDDKSKKFVLDADNDKDHRKLVHKYIKDTYKGIETNTIIQEDGSHAIELSFKTDNSNKQNRKPGWPKDLPKYCHFTLFKQNRDTMECINILAKLVHAKPSHFSYAGTKDRRATTIQRVAAQNVYSKQLSNLRLRNMAVGNFSYKNECIRLGELTGNRFYIVIRDLKESDEQINLSCRSLLEEGFINYFGLQRFGTGTIPTHAIGKVLLQAKFEEAVNMILQFTDDDNEKRFQSAAKKIWQETKDAKKALAGVSKRASIECKILEKLAKQNNSYNYYNAFMALPRNNRLMYLHSYQSIIWNKMVSRRIEEYGSNPCVGDLVICKKKDENGHAMAKILAADDIVLGTYTIYDIVLPLPGYDIIYPSNKIGQYYRDSLMADEIDIDCMKNKIKDISLPGTYRNIMVKPNDMSWDIHKYNDYKVSLIQTDLEKLAPETVSDSSKEESGEGLYKAVKIQMTLSTSCYATSALREILIADSSYGSQIELNKEFMDKDVENSGDLVQE